MKIYIYYVLILLYLRVGIILLSKFSVGKFQESYCECGGIILISLQVFIPVFLFKRLCTQIWYSLYSPPNDRNLITESVSRVIAFLYVSRDLNFIPVEIIKKIPLQLIRFADILWGFLFCFEHDWLLSQTKVSACKTLFS